MKVYLSGGMKSGWQDKVIGAISHNVTFLDPRDHGYKDALLYSTWDAKAVDECDIVFAYMEWNNPSGFGLAAEIGRASGLGKPIIFVDELTYTGMQNSKYFGILREWSTIVTDSLDEGIEHLKKFGLIYGLIYG